MAVNFGLFMAFLVLLLLSWIYCLVGWRRNHDSYRRHIFKRLTIILGLLFLILVAPVDFYFLY